MVGIIPIIYPTLLMMVSDNEWLELSQ